MSTAYDSPLTNLLTETLTALRRCGKEPRNVHWVGTHDRVCSWGSFVEMASAINYDNGYGSVSINPNLVIVGNNWWLERQEYDGSEWWEFKVLPSRPDVDLPLSNLRAKY